MVLLPDVEKISNLFRSAQLGRGDGGVKTDAATLQSLLIMTLHTATLGANRAGTW